MFLERMCQTHISPRLVYPAVGAVLHLTIDYTATSYSYSTLVNAHFPPQQYERKMVQAPEVRESALHVPSWKEQRNTREQLELKAQSGSIGDWKAYILWERKGKKARTGLVPVPYERATERTASGRWAAIWAEDETQLAGAEAAFRGFWEDFLDSQIGEKETPPKLDQPYAKCEPRGGNMWSAYPRQLETHEGEESKDLETLPGVYEHAMAMSVLQSSLDDFGLVVIVRQNASAAET